MSPCSRRYVAVLCALLLTACIAKNDHKDALPKEDGKSRHSVVFTERAEKVDLFDELAYPGQVMAATKIDVIAEIEGVVVSSKIELGKQVRKGTAIATVENTDPVYKYAPLAIYAPVSGVISERSVTVGSRVLKGQKLAVIADLRTPKISIEMIPNDLRKILLGSVGHFTTTDSEESTEVVVKTINPIINHQTGTATVELYAKNGAKLIPGVLGKVRFRTNERSGFSVPEDALVYKGDQPFLRLVQDNKIHYQSVKLGSRRQGHVEILDGLSDQVQWVHRASAYVAEGETVTIQSTEMVRK